MPATEPARRLVEGLEAALGSLEQLGNTQRQLLERLEAQAGGSWRKSFLVVTLGVLLGGAGTFLWVRGTALPERAAGPEPVQAAARPPSPGPAPAELATLERRVAELEAAGRAVASLSLLPPARSVSWPGPAAELQQRSGSPAPDPQEESGRPEAGPPPASGESPELEEVRETEVVAERKQGAEHEEAPDPEVLSEPPDPEVPPAEIASPPATYPSEQLCRAVNQLLRDAGMHEYLVLEASAAVGDHGLSDVVVAHRAADGTRLASIRAAAMVLRHSDTGGAFLELQDAEGQMSGMGVEYPERKLRIPLPGVLRGEWLEPPLGLLFGSDPSRWLPQGATTTLDRLNHVLQNVERLPHSMRAIGGEEDGALRDAILDLDLGTDGAPAHSLHARTLRWELHPDDAYVELCAEGGVMATGEHLRPLFRGRYRKVLRNVNVDAWRGIPGVVEVP